MVFLAAFGGIASCSAGEGITIAFGLAVVAAWTWLTTVLTKARSL